jgi:hypothetical protein
MKYLKVFLIILVMVFATSSTAVADLVNNGGFETGDLSGWTEVGTDPGISLYVANFNPNSGIYNVTTGYSLDWQYIKQDITTMPGQSYTVGFWLSNGDPGGNNAFVARWDGATKKELLDQPYDTPAYTYYSYTEVATGYLTTIEFGFRYNVGWFDFDDVSVNEAPAAVPIPGAIWLLGSGLLGLIGIRRKFKK